MTLRQVSLLLFLLLISCSSKDTAEETTDPTFTLSGTVGDYEEGQELEVMYQAYGERVTEAIKPDSTGAFSLDVDLASARNVYLRNGRSYLQVYGVPGAESIVRFSILDLTKPSGFEGDLANENQFIQDLKALEDALKEEAGDIYELSVEDYQNYSTSVREKSIEFLSSKESELDGAFYAMSQGNIEGRWIGNRIGYINRRGYYHAEDSSALDELAASCIQDLALDKEEWLHATDYLRALKSVCSMKASEKFEALEDQDYLKYYALQLDEAQKMISNSSLVAKTRASIMKDALSYNALDEELETLYNDLDQTSLNEEDASGLKTLYEKWLPLKAGNPAPVFYFSDMEGSESSLEDLKGKLVYVDVWATWCGPCKREIPFLKELEEEYKNKEIVFLSVSIDSTKEPWEKMVVDESLQGMQVFTPGAWNSELCELYNVRSIPRFMLISRDGKIIDVDAPRPSGEIRELIDKNLAS